MEKQIPGNNQEPEPETGGNKGIETALEQERYLMTALMDNVPDHIYFKDLESRFIRNNLAHAASFGLKDPSGLVGKSDFDFFHEDVARQQYKDEQEIIRTGLSLTKEERTIRSDGSVNWYLSTKMPLRDEHGKIVGTFGISRDITRRKDIEQELRKLSQAVEQSPVSIVITDTDGDIEYANPKACQTTGYTLRELIGKNPRVLKSGEKSPEEYTSLWHSISAGDQWKGLFHNKKKNGELYWETATIAPIRDSGGNITHYLGVKEDITEQLKVENALRESESLLRSFFDLPLIGHAITSPTKNWVEVNQALCQLLGYSKTELVQMTWAQLTHPDDLGRDEGEFDRVMAGEIDGYTMEKRFITKDGHPVSTHLAAQCIRHSDRSINYFMVVIVDITAIKEAEKVIRQQNEELLKTNAEKDKFFSIIAHDLRSPFNAFLNLTRIMAEEVHDISPEKISQLSASINKSASALYALLENLLAWSLMKRGLADFKPERVSLNETVSVIVNMSAGMAANKLIDMNIIMPEELEVLADKQMLGAILRNLITNAIKFSNERGILVISAKKEADGKSVMLSVRDTGIGMSPKILSGLFRIDEQVSRKGTAGESSSGLGLLLCKEFVEKQGGAIRAESEENKGSIFRFTIPLWH